MTRVNGIKLIELSTLGTAMKSRGLVTGEEKGMDMESIGREGGWTYLMRLRSTRNTFHLTRSKERERGREHLLYCHYGITVLLNE